MKTANIARHDTIYPSRLEQIMFWTRELYVWCATDLLGCALRTRGQNLGHLKFFTQFLAGARAS
jgi:hypothetical protein